MKRFNVFIALVVAALSGYAQGSLDFAQTGIEFPGRLVTLPVFLTADETVRDLALRKKGPNLAPESHPYFRGPTSEVVFPGGRLPPTADMDDQIRAFPILTPIQPGFRTLPLLDMEIEAIFVRVPLPIVHFDDLIDGGTSLEHDAPDLTVPGVLPTEPEIDGSAIDALGAPLLNGRGELPITTVPEPGIGALFGLGLAGWFICRRRQ